MKKIFLVALAAVGFVAFYVHGSKLSEEQVRDYYQKLERATLERKPEDICALLADNYRASGTVYAGGQSSTFTQNKAEACENARKLYASWQEIGNKKGGLLYLDYDYEIHSIAISPDQKTATVSISYSMDVSGTLMRIRSSGTETLIRRFGKVRELHSESQESISIGS